MIVEIDALDYVIGVYLSQKHKDGAQYPIVFYSRKMTLPKLKYNIYNKELLGIVAAFKEQRAWLQSMIKLFIVKTDYKNLTGFLITKELN